jgi:hypothetical protein
VSSDKRSVGGCEGTLVELKLQGPGGMPLAMVGLIAFGRGFLQTFVLTALDGKQLPAAKADFLKMVDSIRPGSYTAK